MLRNEDRERIKELLGQIECPSEFKCVHSGFRYICKAQYNKTHCDVVCLEAHPENCVFADPMDGNIRCECPLRRYVCEKLGL